MKIIEFKTAITTIIKILEFKTRLMQIMKILNFHLRIMKIIKKQRIPVENNENHENHKISYENHYESKKKKNENE